MLYYLPIYLLSYELIIIFYYSAHDEEHVQQVLDQKKSTGDRTTKGECIIQWKGNLHERLTSNYDILNIIFITHRYSNNI